MAEKLFWSFLHVGNSQCQSLYQSIMIAHHVKTAVVCVSNSISFSRWLDSLRFVPYEFRTFLTKGYKTTKQICHIHIYIIYVRYIFCWLSNSNSKRNSSNSLMHWLFFWWSCQGAQQLFHHVKSSLQKRCFACMCSFCFLCYDSPPKEELIHADKQRLVLQSKFLEVFFVAASNCVWPAIWHLFHHRPVDLERFPPPGASQTFIAHASVEAKSRWGRE